MSRNLKLDPELAEQLGVLLDQPLRDPVKTAEGRRAFLEQAQELEKSSSQAVTTQDQPRRNRWMHLLQTIFSPSYKKERSPMFGALSTILLIVSLVLGGGGVTVAAAQNSMPDQPLYAVKTWSEDARVGLTNNPQTRLDLALQYTQRRGEEMQVMLKAGQIPPEAVQTRMQAEIDLALQLAAGQPDNEAVRAFDQIRQQLHNQDQAFLHLGQPADPQAEALLTRTRDMLRDRLKLCDEGVQNPEMARQQLRDRNRNQQFQQTSTVPAQKPSDTGSGNPWTTLPAGLARTPTPGSGYGPGDGNGGTTGSGGNNPWTTGTPTPGSSYVPGPGDSFGGNNPWTTGTPTPGSGYGPGPGDGFGGNNPWTTGTPTPGSSYGPGPGTCSSCGGTGGGNGMGSGSGSGNGSGSGAGSDSGSGSGSGTGSGSGGESGSGSGSGSGGSDSGSGNGSGTGAGGGGGGHH